VLESSDLHRGSVRLPAGAIGSEAHSPLEAVQDELHRNQALLRAVFEGALDAKLLSDGQDRYTEANPAACDLFGASREELLGCCLADFTAPASEDQTSAPGARRETPGWFRLLRRDGSRRVVERSAVVNVGPGVKLSVFRDITSRVATEEALRGSELRFRRLLEDLPEPVLVHQGRKIVYANAASAAALGFKGSGELLGHSIVEFATPETGKKIQARMADALEAGATLNVAEQTFLRPSDGVLLHAEVKSIPIVYDGHPATLSIARDITQRVQAERAAANALQEADLGHRKLEAVLASLPVGVWIANAEGRLVQSNPAAARIWGGRAPHADSPAGYNVYKASWPATGKPLADEDWALARTLKSGKTFVAEAIDIERFDGTTGHVLNSTAPILDERGVIVGGVVVILDVSEAHAAGIERERLIASLEFERGRLGTLLEKAPAFIAVLRGKSLVFELVNEEYRRLTGSRALLGKPLLEGLPEIAGQGFVERLEKVLETGEPYVADGVPILLVREPGAPPETRYVNFMYQPLVEADGTRSGVFVHGLDVTERSVLEQQLRQSQKMDAVGRLAGGVAHDFNNLLSVILSYSGLTLEELKPGDPLREYLDEIKAAGERAAALTRQLLAFSRQQVLQPRVIDLDQIVIGMKSMLGRLLGEDIELSVLSAPGLGRVLADPGQLEQVVMNLAVNARDAMPAGGKLTFEASNIELSEEYVGTHLGALPGAYVMLAVSDTGTGMDAATQARIFEPFFTTKEQGKGTGLGLSTVFGIVKQSGGHIGVYSELGRGTTFKVYIPRTDRVEIARLARGPAAAVGGSETILFVEDEENVRVVACAILRRNGYHVLEASNGGEAFLIAKDFPGMVHLLLTDVVMPRMSGRVLAEHLTPLRPDMKILFASGYTDDTIVRHGVLEAGVAFLQKPFTSETLLHRVREVLDAGEAQRPATQERR
jgi:two-component system, cell cycle sensor histidine kinase and response regulator CckA